MFMSNVKRMSLLYYLLVSVAGGLLAVGSEVPVKPLSAARVLIEDNSGDSSGRTKHGLLEGLQLVERELERGALKSQPELEEAYLLLAMAYRTLTVVHAPPASQERKLYEERLLASRKKLSELAPENIEYLYQYSVLIPDNQVRLDLWRKIVREHPSFLPVRAALGGYLVEHGSTEEGLKELRYGFTHSRGAEARRFGQELASALWYLGRDKEAQQVQKQVDALPRE